VDGTVIEAWASQKSFQRKGDPPDTDGRNFHGQTRTKLVNVHQFTSINDAKAKIEAWRVDYNQRRPHSSLGHLTPNEFAQQRQLARATQAAFL
jgi:putative transposase